MILFSPQRMAANRFGRLFDFKTETGADRIAGTEPSRNRVAGWVAGNAQAAPRRRKPGIHSVSMRLGDC